MDFAYVKTGLSRESEREGYSDDYFNDYFNDPNAKELYQNKGYLSSGFDVSLQVLPFLRKFRELLSGNQDLRKVWAKTVQEPRKIGLM